jgi:nitrogen fixation protein NifB
MFIDYSTHPCFNKESHHKHARVHLPVAPECNIGCNFCNRKTDCPNESRPGVTSAILAPKQAIAYLEKLESILKAPLSVIGIAGPGDPFATPELTLKTLELCREKYPEKLLCVASNGLNVEPYADDLARLKVSHVTLTINAVDPVIGSKIYRFVRPDREVFRQVEGAEILLARQLSSLKALKARGITVKVNSIVIPTVNLGHIEYVAQSVAAMGADMHNCIPMYPVPETPFENISEPSGAAMDMLRARCGQFIPQMEHCRRCRADAAGVLGEENNAEIQSALRETSQLPLNPDEDRPYFAVASLEGVLINQHLGEAENIWIYEWTQEEGIRHIDTRRVSAPGGGDDRWKALADGLSDCRALFCAAAGQRPTNVLTQNGVRLIVAEGLIEEAALMFKSGQTPRMPVRRSGSCGVAEAGCGSGGCSGTGTGCG